MSMFRRNVGKILQVYTESHPKAEGKVHNRRFNNQEFPLIIF
jgi:hypothetical protein